MRTGIYGILALWFALLFQVDGRAQTTPLSFVSVDKRVGESVNLSWVIEFQEPDLAGFSIEIAESIGGAYSEITRVSDPTVRSTSFVAPNSSTNRIFVQIKAFDTSNNFSLPGEQKVQINLVRPKIQTIRVGRLYHFWPATKTETG